MIGVEFLHRFYPAAATTLPLCSINHLPSLVVLLFSAVAAVCKIEDHSNQYRERSKMFQHIKEPSSPAPRPSMKNTIPTDETPSPTVGLRLRDNVPSTALDDCVVSARAYHLQNYG